VEVLFPSEKLKRQLTQYGELQQRWGDEGAKRVALRLQQLAAAVSLADLRALPGHCHELGGGREGHLAVDLHHPYRLVFRPTSGLPKLKDGSLDWSAVDSVTVAEVDDRN
jgi:proteic killer suppression protein